MMRRSRRFIAMLMMAFALMAMILVSAMPAFAHNGGGKVKCKLKNEETILTANAQACIALGGIVVEDNEVEVLSD
jgi:hypothetical protein